MLEHGADEDEAIAAVLHDAIEDQGGQAAREESADDSARTVAAIVDGCSDADTTPKPPWRRRKEAFLARLADATASVRLVTAADKLDNARSLVRAYRKLGESLWTHFRGGRDGTLWYYRARDRHAGRASSEPSWSTNWTEPSPNSNGLPRSLASFNPKPKATARVPLLLGSRGPKPRLEPGPHS